MRGTPSYKGSNSAITFEGTHSIASAFILKDVDHNAILMVTPDDVTCDVPFNNISPDTCVYLKNVTSDVQDQLNTCLKVENGTLHLTENITITGSNTNNEQTTPYTIQGVTPDELHYLSGVHTNIQHQFDTINAVNDTAFKVVNGLIEMSENVTLEGYDETVMRILLQVQHLQKSLA